MDEVIRLSVGEPDFPTPEHIREAGRQAIADGYTRYTPQPGFDDLREAIAGKFREENGIDVSADRVVVSCGGKHSLYNIYPAWYIKNGHPSPRCYIVNGLYGGIAPNHDAKNLNINLSKASNLIGAPVSGCVSSFCLYTERRNLTRRLGRGVKIACSYPLRF